MMTPEKVCESLSTLAKRHIDQGNYTEQCWSYDSSAEAFADIQDFVKNTSEFGRVTWKWRQPRHDQT